MRKAAQSESVDSLTDNSSESKRKQIEIYANNLSETQIVNPDFDLPSACRLGDNIFAISGKGGIAENPFSSVIQNTTVSDLEPKSWQSPQSSTAANNGSKVRQHSVVEAQNWKLNRAGKVELVATTEKQITSLGELPDCLQN